MLSEIKSNKKSLWTKTTCAYCGVGCGVEAKANKQGLLDIRGDVDHPSNYGELCSKGLALGETVTHKGRLLKPVVNGKETNWNDALNVVANKFKATIDEFGADSVAFYASGQLLTEDYYLANKLMKGFIGSGNIDTNSRLCMASSVVGHKRSFGSDTVPVCYQDLEKTDLIILAGSNLAWCHPVLFQRIKKAKALNPALYIVVIDPRSTATCAIADLHLAITPGTDVALFNGLLKHIEDAKKLDENYIKKYTEGFSEALLSARKTFTNKQNFVRQLSLNETELNRFYEKFTETEKVLTIYSQGINQSQQGSDKVNAILNCHLATGRIGKEGVGPFSITGQPNAMGGREVGGLANTLAAHMEFGNKDDYQRISDFWETKNLAQKPGLKAVELFDAIHSGKIKAIWIMATNPAVSLPDSNKVIEALKKCPLVVVSDCIADTATTRLADVLLPAQGWSEKSGTVTNSERRISRQRRLLPTPGEGKPDWWIIAQVARKMGFSNAFNFNHEGEIFAEYAKMTTLGNEEGKRRDLNLIGLTNLDAQGYSELIPQQWPVPVLQKEIIHQRMFSDHLFFTPSKKAQFIPVSCDLSSIQRTDQSCFFLNTGRLRDHWHTMTRTGTSDTLSAHTCEPFVAMSPYQALKKGFNSGDLITLKNEFGSLLARLTITNAMKKRELFMPIHWNNVTASTATVCSLIEGKTDPFSGQPELKSSPVEVNKWDYLSEAKLLTDEEVDVSCFDYWVKQKVKNGYLYHICDTKNKEQLQEELAHLISSKQCKNISFSNEDIFRQANIKDGKVVNTYIVATNLQSVDLDWLPYLLGTPLNDAVERTIISGKAEGILAKGKIICACKQVGMNEIKNAIIFQELTSTNEIIKCTDAGTGCGGCIPDLENILEEVLLYSPTVEKINT